MMLITFSKKTGPTWNENTQCIYKDVTKLVDQVRMCIFVFPVLIVILENAAVISISIGDTDLRKVILAGKGNRIRRYFDKLHEEMTTTIRLSQAKGQNITQWDEIYDVSGFSIPIHACPRCKSPHIHAILFELL